MNATLHFAGSGAPLETGDISPRWTFRIVDVGSGDALLEGADARTTVDALTAIESIFDVWIYISVAGCETWRQLTPGEHRILWNFSHWSRLGG